MTEVQRDRTRGFQTSPRNGKRVNGTYVAAGDLIGADRQALRDLHAVHDAHRTELEARLQQLAGNDSALAWLAVPDAATRDVRSLMAAAILLNAVEEDAWAEHDRALREFAQGHARAGVRIESWHVVSRVLRELHMGWIDAAYASEPDRAEAATRALLRYLDGALATVARAYLDSNDGERHRVALESRLKSEFLANMSHELRTPLNAIMGFTELMHDGLAGEVSALQQEFLGDILASGRHLLRLVNEVLDLAKIEAGRIQLHPDDIDVHALVAEVRAVLSSLAAKKRITIAVDIDPTIGELHLDPAKLKQVLYNYLSNALKFTHEGGRVVVRLRPEGPERMTLEVEDSGIGIDANDLGRLFVEFQQLDDATTRGQVGTGLGLALTRRLVEAQGGSVGVRSVRGVGSTFHATLPRRLPAVSEPTRVELHGLEAPADARRVLIVDGGTHARDRLAATLGGCGFAVEAVTTGLEALELLRQRPFDALAIDLMLPDMSALEVLRKLRHGKLNRGIPVVLAASGEQPVSGAGLALHDFIAKPLSVDKLVASLASAGSSGAGPILVLDLDDVDVEKLVRAGHHVVQAITPSDALHLAAAEPPRAVVVDVVSHGLEVVAELQRRAIARGQRPPLTIWVASALTDDQLRQLRVDAAQGAAPPLADLVKAMLT